MDKRYKLIATVVMITLFVWVIAGIITTILGHVLYNPPKQQKPVEVANVNRNKQPKIRSDYDVIAARDLLKVAKVRPAGQDQQVAGDADMPLAEMGLSLKGTITGPSEIARAIIEESNAQKLYRIGDTLKGATLIAIFRNKVVMDVNGQQKMLIVEEAKSSPANGSRTARSPRSPRFPAGSSIASAGGIPDAMKNMDQLLGNARVVPYYRGGQPYGFRVSDVAEGAKVYELGVRTGDIIKSINGVPIRTPQDALNAYQELQNNTNVQLEIERQGSTTTVNVPVK